VPPYRIVLADDHCLFREGIKRIIEEIPDLEVVGEAGDGLGLLELVKKTQPDMVILDISMPNLQGIEATNKIKSLFPQVKILILTMHKSKEHLYRAMSAGADGYLLKENAYDDLVSAVSDLREGKTYISNLVYSHMVDFFRLQRRELVQQPKVLSGREREVLELISEGKTSKEIAEKLDISITTVQSHRVNIKKKLNIKKNADLIKYAIQKGYTSSEIL
jgi:DNA-binding NarL/FixJ family response regulator